MTAAAVSAIYEARHEARQNPELWWMAIAWLRQQSYPMVARHYLETAKALGIIR